MTTQSIASTGFWRSYLITARPYLLFVSGAAGVVGLALRPAMGWASFMAAFLALFASYGLGQALTDVSQTDTDALSAPYRPLVQGLISPCQVRAVSLIGLLTCCLVVVALNPWTLALGLTGVAGLASYTWFKRLWWGGPLYNAWVVALLPAIGFLCGTTGWTEALASRELWAAMISVLFSYAVFVVLGYLKDISADRATGYDTLPVRFGWGAAVRVSGGFCVLAVAASSLLVIPSLATKAPLDPTAVAPIVSWVAGVACLATAHVRLLRTRDERKAHPGIAHSVRGFVLLHCGEAAMLRPTLTAPLAGFYLLFELCLALRPERSQV